MPAIYHEGSWLGNATDPEVLVKDTVGWTGKNLLKNEAVSATARGVTRTVNSDGSITLDGTNSVSGPAVIELNLEFELEAGTYILSGTPVGAWVNNAGFRLQVYDFINSVQIATDEGSGKAFTLSEKKTLRTRIWFSDGASISNKTFYPMLRKADITDPTYEPYHESVEVMYEEEIHGVNLLKNKTGTLSHNGVTFTTDSNGYITANGLATNYAYWNIEDCLDFSELRVGDEYILSGCPQGGSNSTYCMYMQTSADSYLMEYGQSAKFTYTGTNIIHIAVQIRKGYNANNVVFKPMLRKADIEDPTYRPYNPQAIQNQLNAQGVLGAKNLCRVTANTQTLNGVTFTVNKDSDGNVINVTVNGTASAVTVLILSARTYLQNTYTLSGCPSGGNQSNSYALQVRDTNNTTIIYDEGNGGTRALSGGTEYRIIIRIANGYTANNLVFYPMLRLASDPDDTYQPYAMTNRELTEKKINIADLKTVVSASSDFTDFKTRIASL